MVRVVKRTLPHVVGVGDVIERDGHRERVVDVRPRDFFLTAPVRRKNLAFGTLTVFYRDLV